MVAVVLSTILSSVMHEFVMFMALGFVLPVVTILFLSFGSKTLLINVTAASI